MKKFLIYLSTFLFLFGVSVAFAGNYIEDFEDFVLGPEWFANGEYEITAIPDGSSTGLHMNRSISVDGGTGVSTNTNELIYHFAADIYLTTSNPWADVELFHHREDGTFILWAGNHLDLVTGSFNVFVILFDSNGQELINIRDILGEYNLETWYSLSFTINDGCVTFGIDGIETNLCDELIQKPDSGFCSGRVAARSDYVNGFVDYWVDNLVAHTLPTSSQLTVTYPNGGEVLTKGEDYTITWQSTDDVSGNILIHLYKDGVMVLPLAANDPNDGAYPFNPPDTLADGSDYYIGISAEGGTIWDFSDAPFTIQAAAADSDGDGIPDYQDNCTNTPNPDQTDANGDGIGDACGPQFINTYAEDFEDGDLDNPWGYAGVYQIIPDPAGSGSLVLNMTEDTGGTEVGNYFDEYVYHFEADVYIPSTHGLILGIVLWWTDLSDPSIGFRTDLKFNQIAKDIWVSLVKKDGTDIGSEILLEPANFDQWYKLSITYLDDHIRVGINGNEKNLFFGSYQKPDSPVQSYCSVHGSDPTLPDPVEGINWYTDNIKAFSISADPNQPPTKPELLSPVENEADVNPKSVTLQWQPSTDVDGDEVVYCVDLRLREVGSPEDIPIWLGCDYDIFTSDSYFSPPDSLGYGKQYWWAVTAKDANDNWSPASNRWSFMTVGCEGTPEDIDLSNFNATCPPEGIIEEWPDESTNQFELECFIPEFAFWYRPASGPEEQVGRCPWDDGKNYVKITQVDNNNNNKADCFRSSFWRSTEPKPWPFANQGEPLVIDWNTYEFDVETGILVLKHFTSRDGPGGPFDDYLEERAVNVNPLHFYPNSPPEGAMTIVPNSVERAVNVDPLDFYPTASPEGAMTIVPHKDCDNDFDGDCDIDDYELVIKAVGQCDDGDNYNEPADADHNGCVTESDSQVLFPVIPVLVDIKPGSIPNCINPDSKGTIAVAILCSDIYDVNNIDPDTIELEGVEPLRWSLKKDVNGDDCNDFVFHFSTQELNGEGLLSDGNTLSITGELLDGTPISGSDTINLAGGPYCFD